MDMDAPLKRALCVFGIDRSRNRGLFAGFQRQVSILQKNASATGRHLYKKILIPAVSESKGDWDFRMLCNFPELHDRR